VFAMRQTRTARNRKFFIIEILLCM
jgi:hypothetical protein